MHTQSLKFRCRLLSLGVLIFGCLLPGSALAQDDTDGDPYPQPTSTSQAPGGKLIDLVSVPSRTCYSNMYDKQSLICTTIPNVQSTATSFYSSVVAGSSTALPQVIDLNLPQGPAQGLTIAIGLDTTAAVSGIQTVFTLKYARDSNGQDIALAVLRDASGAWYLGKRIDGPTTTLRYLTRLWDPQSPCTNADICNTDTIYVSFFPNGQIQLDEFSQLVTPQGNLNNWQGGLLNYGYPISSYASGTLVNAPTAVPAYLSTYGLSIGTLPGNEFGVTSYNPSSANYSGARITRAAVWTLGTIGGDTEALLEQAMVQDQSSTLAGANTAWLPCNSGLFQRLTVSAPSTYSPGSLFTPCSSSGINYAPLNLIAPMDGTGFTLSWSPPPSPVPNPVGYTAILYDHVGSATSVSTSSTSANFNGLRAGENYTVGVASNYANSVPNNIAYIPAKYIVPTDLELYTVSSGQLLVWDSPLDWSPKSVDSYILGLPGQSLYVGGTTNQYFLNYSNFPNLGNNLVTLIPFFTDSTRGGTAQITMNVKGTLDVSQYMNVYGDYTDGQSFSTGGMDGKGHSYSANQLHSYLSSPISFNLVSPNGLNAVRGKNLALPSLACSTITLLATGVNGNQANQNFTVTYTDGSTARIKQSMSDWGSPQHYANETIAAQMSYRANANGTKQNGNWYVYSYTFGLDNTKTLSSFNLGSNTNLVTFAITLQ